MCSLLLLVRVYGLLFDWISLLFTGFVFIINSLVILYRDLNIFRFILLALMSDVSTFLIISPKPVSRPR
jgi:hypothetical protein